MIQSKAKRTVSDLAILGGSPIFSRVLHVGRPNLAPKTTFLKFVDHIYETKWLTNNGPLVEELERALSSLLNVKHCILTCNGTLALELAIKANDLKGEVILPAFTFVATAHALQWLGLTPVFCDINRENYTLDPARARELITEKTSGIIGVHLWGLPCRIDALTSLAEEAGLKCLFDAAQAFGNTYRGRRIGGFGDTEIFSFHATKWFNTFEGGAVVTQDDAIAERVRLMRNFGFSGYDKVVSLGTNAKMSEISAAMGLASLEIMNKNIQHNKYNYELYKNQLKGLSNLTLLNYDDNEIGNYHYVILFYNANNSMLSRDDIVNILQSENIMARRYFYPGCHKMEPYCSTYDASRTPLPITDNIARQVIALPTGSDIDDDDITVITGLLEFIMEHGSKVAEALRTK